MWLLWKLTVYASLQVTWSWLLWWSRWMRVTCQCPRWRPPALRPSASTRWKREASPWSPRSAWTTGGPSPSPWTTENTRDSWRLTGQSKALFIFAIFFFAVFFSSWDRFATNAPFGFNTHIIGEQSQESRKTVSINIAQCYCKFRWKIQTCII